MTASLLEQLADLPKAEVDALIRALAPRGFGKTRSGAEWVRAEVKAGGRRIALVGPTAADARRVMVEGASGILAISPDPERPLYEPSKRRLTWPNGAIATTYSADQPEPPARSAPRRGMVRRARRLAPSRSLGHAEVRNAAR